MCLAEFIHKHINDDVTELILKQSQYPQVDIREAAAQILARQKIRNKLPSWYSDFRLTMPSSMAAEQCSSELTAAYKQRFVTSDDCVCDLTGGMGVDTLSFAQIAKNVLYIERNPDFCIYAERNFKLFKSDNISVLCGDAEQMILTNDERLKTANIFYFDPSRRSAGGQRVFSLHDCEPDLTKLWRPIFSRHHCRVIAKLSPMLDIANVLTLLPQINSIHIVAVKNDCKELTVTADANNDPSDIEVFCINYTFSGEAQTFNFKLADEHQNVAAIASKPLKYLYEPNVAILKAGAYKTVAMKFALHKLHINSHLYTSNELIESFPGRVFTINEIISFNRQTVRELAKKKLKADITVRNFPVRADELRNRLNITEGGNITFFATTLADNSKVLISCSHVATAQGLQLSCI